MLYLIIIILRPKVKTGIAKRKAELKCLVASDDKDLSPKEIRQKNRIIHVSSEFIIVFFNANYSIQFTFLFSLTSLRWHWQRVANQIPRQRHRQMRLIL